MAHDTLVTLHCFVESHIPWCFGESLIVLCGFFTLFFSIWCLYRMLRNQNESISSTRSIIIYLAIILCIISIFHGLFIDGSSLSLTASYLVSVQCSFFTIFFIKIGIRTNNDSISISISIYSEKLYQFIYLLLTNIIQLSLYIYSLYLYRSASASCHSTPFMLFAIIDSIQILFTMCAVYTIHKKIKKKHQKVSINVNKPDNILQVENSLGQIQMLQKSHQLLKLIIFIFISLIITTIYETWNYIEKDKPCSSFIDGHDWLNEILRLIARITWLYIPTCAIIYVFWIWPVRPKKYIINNEKHNKILNKLCCYCFHNQNVNSDIDKEKYGFHIFDDDGDDDDVDITQNGTYNDDDDDDIKHIKKNNNNNNGLRQQSMDYQSNNELLLNDNDINDYNNDINNDDDNDSSISYNESDSDDLDMIGSNVWDIKIESQISPFERLNHSQSYYNQINQSQSQSNQQ